MVFSPQLVGSVQILAGMVALILLKPAVDNFDKPGSRGYAVFTAGVGLWMFGLAIPKFTMEYRVTVSGFHFLILGTELAVAGWLLLALSVTDYVNHIRQTAIGLGAGIFLLQLLLWTNHVHQFLYTPGSGVTAGVVHNVDTVVMNTFGWWWVHTTASYLCGLTGEALLIRGAIRSTGIRRKQFAWLSFIAVPILPASIVSTFGIFNLPYNVSSVGFLLAVPILAVVLFRARFLDIVPVARRTVMDEMDAAIITLDRHSRVVDANERARKLFDNDPGYVGTPADEFFESGFDEMLERFSDEDDVESEITITNNGRERYFAVSRSPVGTSPEHGSIILLHDITPQKRREQELEATKQSLEQSNEKLNKFASTVSHDLRNPLNVAQLRLDLAQTEAQSENEHLVAVEEAHERMESLIGDLLVLARQGDVIEEKGAVDVTTLAENTWQNISTAEATLVVETAQTIRADSPRLQELLENLFRNAVEHGGEEVVVTLGEMADGFYVADDGPGVSVEHRGDVFDSGYSSADDGTGFGLNIAQEIAGAHGWEICLTDSKSDGARFEITGVEVID
ncbi:histidine kinase N-terminal 7TM domain-containing protein [Halovenus rubra]|uniref:Histidine kinase N-terminal 7TM domain-containing protein n=2 Tax=Halovenus rubra TaxID=869890 RepID=A0ACC7DYJ9_9EURY|nr:histidine kinase N-terminal 7TM domain-containing protein [Halovenus rubra]